MVARLHNAGIEVILDVVYNHTAEGNELGPTLSFKGIDNASYYRLADDRRYYINDTGTGNTFDLTNAGALRMVMDSLRYWVTEMRVDGFRFDLATILGRERHGFDASGSFLDAVRQDPILSQVKLIAEPWDIGPGATSWASSRRGGRNGTTASAIRCARCGAEMAGSCRNSLPASPVRPTCSITMAGDPRPASTW